MDSQVNNELISAYFDGEASPEERAEVERLLADNDESRRELNEIAKLSALLHSFPRESAPVDLAGNVERQTSQLAMPGAVTPTRAVPPRDRLRELKAGFIGSLITMAGLVLIAIVWNQASVPGHRPVTDVAAGNTTGSVNNLKQMASNRPMAAPSTPPRDLQEMKESGPRLSDAPSGPLADHSVVMRSATQMPLPAKSAWGMDGTSTAEKRMAPANPGQGLGADPGNSLSNAQVEGIAELDVPNQEFVQNLRAGKLVQIVDNDANVGVVEVKTVVDYERGVGEFTTLLLKNDIRPRSVSEKGKSEEKSAARNSADDMAVFFVQATGEQVANVIVDVEHHPDIFAGWSKQQPLPLEQTFADAKSAEDAAAVAQKPGEVATKSQAPDDKVDDVAKQALNRFLERQAQIASANADEAVEQENAEGSRKKDASVGGFSRRRMAGNDRSSQKKSEILNDSNPLSAEVRNEAVSNSYQTMRLNRSGTDMLTNPLNNPQMNSNLGAQQQAPAYGNSRTRGQIAGGGNQMAVPRAEPQQVNFLIVLHPPVASEPASPAPNRPGR